MLDGRTFMRVFRLFIKCTLRHHHRRRKRQSNIVRSPSIIRFLARSTVHVRRHARLRCSCPGAARSSPERTLSFHGPTDSGVRTAMDLSEYVFGHHLEGKHSHGKYTTPCLCDFQDLS